MRTQEIGVPVTSYEFSKTTVAVLPGPPATPQMAHDRGAGGAAWAVAGAAGIGVVVESLAAAGVRAAPVEMATAAPVGLGNVSAPGSATVSTPVGSIDTVSPSRVKVLAVPWPLSLTGRVVSNAPPGS